MYFRKKKKNKWIIKYVDRYYSREFKKNYGESDYSYVIHYSGYGEKTSVSYTHLDVYKRQD